MKKKTRMQCITTVDNYLVCEKYAVRHRMLINQWVAHFNMLVLPSDHFLIFPVIIRWKFSCRTKKRIKNVTFHPNPSFFWKINGLVTPIWFCILLLGHFLRLVLTIRWKFNSVTTKTLFFTLCYKTSHSFLPHIVIPLLRFTFMLPNGQRNHSAWNRNRNTYL